MRVYKKALEIYESKGWLRAQDYVNYLMSQLNFKLKNFKEALENIESILYKKKKFAQSTHSKHHQHNHHQQKKSNRPITVELANEANVLKDFITYSNLLNRDSSLIENKPKTLPNIPLPFIEYNNIKINLNPFTKSDLKYGSILVNNDNFIEQSSSYSSQLSQNLKSMWDSFEEGLYTTAFNAPVPMLFKLQLSLFDKQSDNKQMPKVVVDEIVSILIDLKNNLKTSLILSNITLLWKMIDQSNPHQEITNEFHQDLNEYAECSSISELKILSNESVRIKLTIKPKKPSNHLHILGIKYNFSILENSDSTEKKSDNSAFLHGKQLFDIRGVRLNNNQQNMRSTVYDTDNRLNFKIINKTALMKVIILFYDFYWLFY